MLGLLRNRPRLLSILVLISFGLAAVADARPRIGLALSGGGARGFAHVGVLEVLEEKRIPVDYVAGTSMGGLVGGLYAMGWSPDEIRELVDELDWPTLFRRFPEYQDLSWLRKNDHREFGNQFEWGLKDGLSPPGGLNSGHQIGLILDRVALPYGELDHFDRLPIPFRCVATDMEAAEVIVIGDGDLSSALRATMSIPGVFSAVERDGRILADGGVLNNLPVDVVRAMGADIVIAVDIGTPLLKRDELRSLFGMVSQALSIMMVRATRANLERADLVLQPDLGDHTNMDFRAADAIAHLGRVAAELSADLDRLAVDESAFEAHLAARAARRRPIAPPAQVAVSGGTEQAQRWLSQRLEPVLEELDPPLAIEHELTGAVGTGRFARASYGLRDESLDVQLQPKENGPPFVRFGLDLGHDGSESIDLALKARLIAMDVGRPGSEIRADVGIGTDQWAGAEYFLRLTNSGFFVAPEAFAERSTTNLYEDGERIADFNVSRAGFGLSLGFLLGRSGELRLGGVWDEIDASVAVGQPTIGSIEGREQAIFLRWFVDRRNGPIVPTDGFRIGAVGSWVFETPDATDEFGQFEAIGSFFQPVSAESSLYLVGSGGTTFDTTAPPTKQFTIGGPFNVSSLRPDERRGSHFVTGALGYLHPIADLPLILGRSIYATGLVEAGSAFEGRIEDARFDVSFGGGAVAETILGGVMLGAAVGNNGDFRWFFRIGRLF